MQITKVTVPELESACVLPPIPGNFGEGSGSGGDSSGADAVPAADCGTAN